MKKASSKNVKIKIGQDLPDEADRLIKKNDNSSSSPSSSRAQWDVYKENIQPISQGRKMNSLMSTLPLITDQQARQQQIESRKRQFDADIEASSEELSKQLDLWYEYIDWLEQNVPDGGKINVITNAIEQCIEIFYDKKEFKQDKRLFDIFMKFKRFCDEPIEIFGFMYANSICSLLARFYLNWSWQYEIKRNLKRAEDLIKLGIKNLATPRDVLEEAQEQLRHRIARMIRAGELDDHSELAGPLSSRETQAELAQSGIRAALQTLKFKMTKKSGIKVPINRIGSAVELTNVGGLKSQSRLVNGVRVANAGLAKTAKSSKLKPSNKPVLVFSEQQEMGNENGPTAVAQGRQMLAPGAGDENSSNGGGLAHLMTKIPTSQKIRSVGRHGLENQQPHFGSISGPNK